jgi:guanylate kinase
MHVLRFSGENQTGVQYVKAIKKAPGRFILVSGPSGVGKGTIIANVLEDPAMKDVLQRVSSVTTRAPRPGEVKRGQYEFLTEPDFLQTKQQNGLFQWAKYDGNWYGSRVKEVLAKLQNGVNVLFELASKDALEIKRLYGNKVTTVFIAPPAPEFETLKKRLVGRGTNSDASIQERLRKAQEELALKPQFDTVIVNEDNQVDAATAQLKSIILNPVTPSKISQWLKWLKEWLKAA